MTDVITFRERNSNITESYDCTDLPESLWRPLALVGAKALLRMAKNRAEMYDHLMNGELLQSHRAARNSDWKQAACAVKVKKLKKEGHSDPETGALEWWINLSVKDRQKLRHLPAIITEHAKITGKPLQEI